MMEGRVSPVMEARFAQDANSLVATLSRRLRAVRLTIARAPAALASPPTTILFVLSMFWLQMMH